MNQAGSLSLDKLLQVEQQLTQALAALSDRSTLESFRLKWLTKDGILRTLFAELRSVPAEQKPEIAARLNSIKSQAEVKYAQIESGFIQQEINLKLAAEFFDLSLPTPLSTLGSAHPITEVERRITQILRPFGFENVLGPEIESEYFCFDALNIPAHHPARDMQDTFYTDSGHVLRTHTTSVQARVLQAAKMKAPVKVASFGRVYRNETEDPSHQAMFHQFELVWLEKGLTLSNLIALIHHILRELYGKRRKIRVVPKFYPYTEPSLGPQIDCSICKGSGCSACAGAGWVTVAGAGMVHRKVLREFGYDPEQISGLAFGLGTSRLAAQFFGFPNLKSVYQGDLRVFRPEQQ